MGAQLRTALLVALALTVAACAFDASGASGVDPAGGDDNGLGGAADGGATAQPDSGRDDVTGDPDAAPVSTPPSACEDACDQGECQDGVCVIDCSDKDSCEEAILCPDGVPCRVDCAGENSCAAGVACGGATDCNVDCTGRNSCAAQVTCGQDACDIQCTGDRSCAASVDCHQSCSCNVDCRGNDCKPDAFCPAFCGLIGGECFGDGLCNQCN